MSQICIKNLTFGYGGAENVFDNINLNIDTYWKTGIVGRNGKGKTTLLKILEGQLEYKGIITSSENFTYFPFDTDNNAVTLDIIHNTAGNCELWQVQKEISLLCVCEDVLFKPFKFLSFGERTKILLAALFLKQNNFLLIDEPTNHLDIKGRQTVSMYLKSKNGFIVVSHDRAFLDNCTDHIIAINKTDIEVVKGNFSVWYQNKTMQDEYEIKQNEILKKDIDRLKKAAEKTKIWSEKAEAEKYGENSYDKGFLGHKAAKIMKRALSVQKRQLNAADEKQKLLKNIDYASDITLSPLFHHKKKLAEVIDLKIMYGGKTVCQNINFTVNQSEKVSIFGANGKGKTSILKLLCGENICYSGSIDICSDIIISYVSQDVSQLCGSLNQLARKEGIDITKFFTLLRKLDFSREQLEKDISSFSEGQKKKAVLSASLCKEAHLYIWDEPLNYIDILSRIQIEKALKQSNATVIFVEHDISFNNNIATKKINI